ncbi:MAG: glucuronate isomerase [Verrucomicrobiae bacterium]
MKTYITEDFLLHSPTACELYHGTAKALPIFDYHTHLPPDQIARDHRFADLFEVWLAGDHYKWRAMRTNGVAERLCTGSATPREKFQAWAETVPFTLRNPLHHWTHLELLRYFDVDVLLDGSTAEEVWVRTSEMLASPGFSVRGLLDRSNVAVVCTTDDPTDTLEHHRKLDSEKTLRTRVYPTFRPDRALAVDRPDVFGPWLEKLCAVSGHACATFQDFLDAIESRHAFFHENGCRLSDHGLSHCFGDACTGDEAAGIYSRARDGQAADTAGQDAFAAYLMTFFGRLDARRGWVKQLHLGAQRNNNTRLFRALGPDTGFDSIGDWPQAASLARYLDALDRTDELPKTILYNLNPASNYAMGTMIGNFQDGSHAGKIQFGSGWWFLDQKEGMEWQINALSSLGLLSRFVGMLTDSRSFLSYPRHEYFRRILCNIIGSEVDRGELPRDIPLLGRLVRDVCFDNAARFFGLPHGERSCK